MTATAPLAHAVREIAAPAERVYDAWIEPNQVMRWMFAPGEPAVHARNEPSVGGRFSYCVSRGGQNLDHVGTYVELERPTRLVFTWGVGSIEDARSQVTVTIRSKDGARCACAVDHALLPQHAAMVDTCARSWTKMLDRLAALWPQGLASAEKQR
jgi:uncharacterized protein YndB with AHSA1/START domain